MRVPRRLQATLLGALALAATQMAFTSPTATPATSDCPVSRAALPYVEDVRRALDAKHDLWGDRLLARPEGVSYTAARRLLEPLHAARGRGGRPLTTTGAYYLPFAMPTSLYGEKAFALHVADGSEVVTRRVGGPSLRLVVGKDHELFGSCAARTTPATLVDGYLPILRTTYVDANGVRYRQESFAGRTTGVRSLVSFARLSFDATAAGPTTVRLTPSVRGSRQVEQQLVSEGATRLAFSPGGTFDGRSIVYRLSGQGSIYFAWVHQPAPADSLDADPATYASARAGVWRYWSEQLGPTRFVVPEQRVLDAQRSLLIQQHVLTWRYSIGNPYEELSFAEALDTAQVMASYGYGEVARAILRFTLKRLPERYTNWRAGARLVAAATYHRLIDDPRFLAEETPELTEVVDRLAAQIERPGATGLLDREAYSSDIQRKVVALHGQVVVWQGLTAMARVWAGAGRPGLAGRSSRAARRLEAALRQAVAASQRRLADGSLFVPAALFEGREPFDRLTASREGSYWNLVTPYALASGFFPAGGIEARGLLRYMLRHGSRLLGLVRAGSYTLSPAGAATTSGTDQVYGLNVSRFLADNDEPDQLGLSLYGTLAAAMTPETYISGEAASVAPIDGARHRAMYLPPNGGTNSTLLETLRLMLVHETRGGRGAPRGLELAFSTPRAWIADRKTIRVDGAPTSFGPVSYTIERRARTIRATVDAPRARSLRLRLRLPGRVALGVVRVNGEAVPFDRATSTIDLDGRSGKLVLTATIVRA